MALTAAGRRLYDELFPQIAAINAAVLACLDDDSVHALDAALSRLTQEAERLNLEVQRDVRADRRAGGSRRVQHGADDGD